MKIAKKRQNRNQIWLISARTQTARLRRKQTRSEWSSVWNGQTERPNARNTRRVRRRRYVQSMQHNSRATGVVWCARGKVEPSSNVDRPEWSGRGRRMADLPNVCSRVKKGPDIRSDFMRKGIGFVPIGFF